MTSRHSQRAWDHALRTAAPNLRPLREIGPFAFASLSDGGCKEHSHWSGIWVSEEGILLSPKVTAERATPRSRFRGGCHPRRRQRALLENLPAHLAADPPPLLKPQGSHQRPEERAVPGRGGAATSLDELLQSHGLGRGFFEVKARSAAAPAHSSFFAALNDFRHLPRFARSWCQPD